MLNFAEELLREYEPVGKDSIQTALDRLGVDAGVNNSEYEFGNQRHINTFYNNIVWVYRSVGFIASNLARLPWRLQKNTSSGNIIDYTNRQAFTVFRSPNKFQTDYDFKFETFARLMLQGEAFWELSRGPRTGLITSMYADWRSEEVRVLGDARQMIKGYERTLNGKTFAFSPDQIFYLKNLNPQTNLRGLSPLHPARHTTENELNATFFNKQFFKQGARPSAIITTDQKLTIPEQERLEGMMRKKYSSVDQMHEIAVLWGGLKWQPLNSMSMTDMQFKDLKMMNRQEIVSTYGLSLEVLGIGEKTYENVRYYRRMAWTETLMPINEQLLSFINKKLVPEFIDDPQVKLIADYSYVEALKEDREKKRKDYVEGVKLGALTRNELRVDVFGKEPMNDAEMNKPVVVSGAGQGAGGGGSSSDEERQEQTQ